MGKCPLLIERKGFEGGESSASYAQDCLRDKCEWWTYSWERKVKVYTPGYELHRISGCALKILAMAQSPVT